MIFIDREIEIPPRLFTIAILIGALATLTYGLIFQNWIMVFATIFLPLAGILFIYSVRYPRLSYGLYAIASYYITVIMRYSGLTGLSLYLDILLAYIFLCILFNILRGKKDIYLPNAVNVLTLGYIVWMLYILLVFANAPSTEKSIIMGTRSWLLGVPILYIISSLLADKPKLLRNGLILVGILTITAFLKLLYQKYRWFDAAEMNWLLNQGGASTHLLSSGIRYFSIFSDAGNFGPNMGMITIIYGIVSSYTPRGYLRYFYLLIAVLGCIGMFMSGTRSAIIVPLGGLGLYCLVSKNLKTMLISILTVISMYLFFTLTNVGDENAFVRRMRTAFKPTEDASFQLRMENQKKIREYILTHPWGTGIGGEIPRIEEVNGQFVENYIPPDSFYVDIWTQTGYPGLILYISIYVVVLLRCCYIVMFRIRNKRLRNTLAALICGVFGMWLNGYAGRAMGMPPNGFLITAALAFVLNGPYMDRQIKDNRLI